MSFIYVYFNRTQRQFYLPLTSGLTRWQHKWSQKQWGFQADRNRMECPFQWRQMQWPRERPVTRRHHDLIEHHWIQYYSFHNSHQHLVLWRCLKHLYCLYNSFLSSLHSVINPNNTKVWFFPNLPLQDCLCVRLPLRNSAGLFFLNSSPHATVIYSDLWVKQSNNY